MSLHPTQEFVPLWFAAQAGTLTNSARQIQ
jgi:hypothetical protein